MSEEVTSSRRQLRGKVVSNKMDKTVIVAVQRKYKHPRYHKYLSRVEKFSAHDEDNTCQIDDIVVIEECRPLSRTKRWKVIGRVGGNGTTDTTANLA